MIRYMYRRYCQFVDELTTRELYAVLGVLAVIGLGSGVTVAFWLGLV